VCVDSFWFFYSQFPSLQWAEVFRRFDHVDLFIPDARAFSVLLDMWRLATATAAGVPPFPLTAMLFPEQPYRSAKGHLSLLRAAMQSPPETGVDFLLFSPRALRSVPAPPFDGSNELNLTVQVHSTPNPLLCVFVCLLLFLQRSD
jgi:hypothetical protein